MLVMDRIQSQSCCNFAGGLSNFAGGLSRQLLRSNAGMFYKKCQILEIGGKSRKEFWNLNLECLPKKLMRGNLENERKEELNCNLFQKSLHQSITLVIIKNYFKLHIKLRTIILVIKTKLSVCLRPVKHELLKLLPLAEVVVSGHCLCIGTLLTIHCWPPRGVNARGVSGHLNLPLGRRRCVTACDRTLTTLVTNIASVSTSIPSVANYSLACLATTLPSMYRSCQRLITSDRSVNDGQCIDRNDEKHQRDRHDNPNPQLLHRVSVVSSHPLILYLQNQECQEPQMLPRREGELNSNIAPGLSEIYIKRNQIVCKLPLTTCEGEVAWLPIKLDLKFEPKLAFSLNQIFLHFMSCVTCSDIKSSHYKCLVSYLRSDLATTSNINCTSMNVIKQIKIIFTLICP